ncbi:4Fe-4S binding protein [Candidatus Harpocratesius sp.]
MVRTEQDIKLEKKVSQIILASQQTPAVGEAGHTGEWRTKRPILHKEKCLVVKTGKLTCNLCWLYCPENTVSRSIPPKFNYDYCKGCGICATECPAHAIEMISEKEAPSCEGD